MPAMPPAFQELSMNSDNMMDLGEATEQTKGWNFDYVYEPIPKDKKYNF